MTTIPETFGTNRLRVPLLARPALLFGFVLLTLTGCGPDNRKPFVGVWRLDADYFKEQLEKQELKADEAKAALEQSIPLWTSFKVEYTFKANGRYQMATQMGSGNVASEQGTFEVVEGPTQTLRFMANDEKQPRTLTYRFVDNDTLELDVETTLVGFPKTARLFRAKSATQMAPTPRQAAP